jgi:hypothetical protein
LFIALPQGVDDKKNHSTADRPERNPALLVAGKFVALGQGIGIVEGESGSLETDIVLEKVLPVLAIVPFEVHGLRPGLEINAKSA